MILTPRVLNKSNFPLEKIRVLVFAIKSVFGDEKMNTPLENTIHSLHISESKKRF